MKKASLFSKKCESSFNLYTASVGVLIVNFIVTSSFLSVPAKLITDFSSFGPCASGRAAIVTEAAVAVNEALTLVAGCVSVVLLNPAEYSPAE